MTPDLWDVPGSCRQPCYPARSREGEEPALRMIRRDCLSLDHPGYAIPKRRLRHVA